MADSTTTTAPATPSADAPAKKEKPEGQVGKYQELFDSAEAATKEANGRTKGPNRAFTAKFTGKDGVEKTFHVVAGNWDRAAGIAFMQCGGVVDEIGKPERTKTVKPVGIDGIMAAVNALPEAERDAVMAQLKALAVKKEPEAAPAPAPAATPAPKTSGKK